MAEHDVEQVWQEFWLPIVAPEGEIDIEQIKRELYDYRQLIKGLPEFFMDITGGRVSKPNTNLRVVAELVEEHIDSVVKEAVEEEIGDRQFDADEAKWQAGYDKGHEDGYEQGIERGLDEARNRI